jgi:hypothetical protein
MTFGSLLSVGGGAGLTADAVVPAGVFDDETAGCGVCAPPHATRQTPPSTSIARVIDMRRF